MVFVFVRLFPSLEPSARGSSVLYMLLLPSVHTNSWDELTVRDIPGMGCGAFGNSKSTVDWEQLSWPIALPYFGVETVTSSSNVIKDLRAVLRSAFSIVTVREVV